MTTTPELVMWFKGTGSTPVFGGNKGIGGAAHHPYFGIPVNNPQYGNPPPDLGYHTYVYYGVRLDAPFTGSYPSSSTHGYVKAGYITSKDFWNREYPLEGGYLNCISPGATADGLLVEWRVAGQTTSQCAFAAKDDHFGTPLIQIVKDGSGWKVYYADTYGPSHSQGYTNLAVQFGGQVFSTGFTDTTAGAGVFAGPILTPSNTIPPFDPSWKCGSSNVYIGYPHSGDGDIVTEAAVRVRRGGGQGQWSVVREGEMIEPAVAAGWSAPMTAYGDIVGEPDPSWFGPGNEADFSWYSGTACNNPLNPPGPPAITTMSLPAGTTTQAYSQSVTASGGTVPYSWTVSSGALPPGLSLSAGGTPSATISGTPSTPGTYAFTIRVTDNTAVTDTQDFTIVVSPPPAPAPNPPILDDFNRSPENPVSQGGNWSAIGVAGGPGAPLSQNRLRSFPAPAGGYSYRVTPYLGGDMEAAAKVVTRPNTNHYLSVFVCLQEAGTPGWDGYELRGKVLTGTDLWEIRRVVNGSSTVIASANLEIASDGTMLLRRWGGALEFWWKPSSGAWSLHLTVSDAAYMWGMIGAGGYSSGALDDFAGGSLLSLLEQYAPELRYHPSETYSPDNARIATDLFLDGQDHTNLLRRITQDAYAAADPASPLDDLSLGYLTANADPDDYLDQPHYWPGISAIASAALDYQYWVAGKSDVRHRAYGRVVTDPLTNEKYVQYWFFYYYNPKEVQITGLGEHEGDWEWFQVRLSSAGVPTQVAVSQHGGGERCDWGPGTPVASNGHPVVWVAHESHANYLEAGDHPIEPGFTDYTRDDGPHQIPSVTDITVNPPGWITWDGFWGASAGAGNSPRSPGQQRPWNDAWGWQADTQSCSPSVSARRGLDSSGTVGEQVSGDHAKSLDQQSSLSTPPLPQIFSARVVRGTKLGTAIRVSYCFRSWPDNRETRPWRLHLALDNPRDKLFPLSVPWKVKARCGRILHPTGAIEPPYQLRYFVENRKTERSKLKRLAVG